MTGTKSETVPVTHGGRTYKVKQGDTLYAVASRHGVSVPALAELNRISPRQNLVQGQVLSLPEKNDLPETDPSHIVAPGETLFGIAASHGVSPGTRGGRTGWARTPTSASENCSCSATPAPAPAGRPPNLRPRAPGRRRRLG
ncbi:LysM peptidoglycan-binding domain-containing protein [Brevibacterium casei]|nr:LysM peptidoglycan-binding domain-containing protein [Brevibacterium casei]